VERVERSVTDHTDGGLTVEDLADSDRHVQPIEL
jgi:hypothetical protein